MKVCARRFNSFLALAAAVALLGGCRTDKQDKEFSTVRVFMEANPGPEGTTKTISVLRADPLQVTISATPILTEANVVTNQIISAPGGFGLQIQFDENGTWILEQYSAANSGDHFVIFGQWGKNVADSRWLAAPLIAQRIANGVLSFTPDMSRAEADRFVRGLNNVAKINKKNQFK